MTSHMLENVHLKNEFRKDINILRAVAVLSVVFFHFGFGFARGGYLGVDIFFVISGYLMTAIILSRMDNRRFSLSGFYISRVLRIVPALSVLCIILLIAGWFLIFPYDYAYLGRNINHALMFKSNFSFARGSGYFDTGTDVKWLLHTWSLSAEMQFYVLYPLILLLLHKFLGRASLRLVLLAATLISFSAYVWAMFYGDPNHAFYLLPYRAWELLAGALVVVFPIHSASDKPSKTNTLKGLRYVGALLVVSSVIFAFGKSEFAILWAFLATLGTALIIATPGKISNPTSPGIKQLSEFVHYTGLISYSLYLWHWPIRSLQQYFGYENNLPITFGAMIITYILAALSFHLVERKAHLRLEYGKIFNRKTALALVVFLVTVFLPYSAAKMVRKADGIVQRLDSLPYDNIPAYLFKNPELYLLEGVVEKCKNNGTACQLTNGTKVKNKNDWKPDVILMGDSHAMAVAHALSETPSQDRFLHVLLSASSACIFMKDFDQTRTGDRKFERCKNAYQNLMTILGKTPSDVPLFMVNYYSAYFKADRWKQVEYEQNSGRSSTPVPLPKAWLDLVCTLSAKRNVYILRSVPTASEPVIHKLVQNVLRGTTDSLTPKSFAISTAQHDQNTKDEKILLESAAEKCGAKLVDPAPTFCDAGFCYGTSSDIKPYYRDTAHLNLYGARKLIPLFSESFAK
ncbi:hypothetical protein A9Q83_12165 [Alphaproteobacteria bacterium 46_93_T64]|nr:hypothetical protein A9Q83_12165 [Alphaproteobacteria bacterium 46_93_T64]